MSQVRNQCTHSQLTINGKSIEQKADHTQVTCWQGSINSASSDYDTTVYMVPIWVCHVNVHCEKRMMNNDFHWEQMNTVLLTLKTFTGPIWWLRSGCGSFTPWHDHNAEYLIFVNVFFFVNSVISTGFTIYYVKKKNSPGLCKQHIWFEASTVFEDIWRY